MIKNYIVPLGILAIVALLVATKGKVELPINVTRNVSQEIPEGCLQENYPIAKEDCVIPSKEEWTMLTGKTGNVEHGRIKREKYTCENGMWVFDEWEWAEPDFWSNQQCCHGIDAEICCDSDGANIYNKGFVIWQGQKWYDFCHPQGLGERSCVTNIFGEYLMTDRTYTCPSPTQCNDGRCM